jgi:hypothetical protein
MVDSDPIPIAREQEKPPGFAPVLVEEAITESGDSENPLRAFGILFKLLAQARDVHVHGTRER